MDKTFITILLVVLVSLSAFFSGSETIYAQCNKLKLKKMGENGNKKALEAYKMAMNYPSLISVILIGNNLVNIAASSFATVLFVDLFEKNGALYAGFIVTGILLLFGEILPKTILPLYSTKLACIFTGPLKICNFIFGPLVKLITKLLDKISKFWTPKKEEDDTSDEELLNMVETIEEEGYIDNDTKELVASAIDLRDTQAYDIMTPRVDIFAFDINDDYRKIIKNENIFKYSRLLVYNDTIDDIVGVVNTRSLILNFINNKKFDFKSLITPPIFVHKTKSLTSILKVFRETHTHIAIVVDEFGGTLGIITLEDLLEEVVGDIWDEMDEVEEETQKESEGVYLIDGDMNIDDFFEFIKFDDDEYECSYTTVSGWCTEMLDKFPKENDTFEFAGYKVTILEVDGVRAEKIKLEEIKKESE